MEEIEMTLNEQKSASVPMKEQSHRTGAEHSIEELREWAAELRRKFLRGELPECQIQELEKTPGWTWDQDAARRAGL